MPTVKPKPNNNKRRRRRNRTRATKVGQESRINQTSKAVVAHAKSKQTSAPIFRNTREGCTISHREFVSDIARSNNGFVLDSYFINPGISNTFPWLAQIASRFESYSFERLDFIYEPMVPTTQAGTVMMAIDFDAADAQPSNKQVLMSYQGANRSAPWQPFRIRASAIDRRKMVAERYTRSGQLSANLDIKTYDIGDLHIATIGTGTTAVTLGELYVEYTVKFRTPQISIAPSVELGQRTTQSGIITVNASGIVSNLANIIGEGATPALLATGAFREFVVNPNLRSFLLTLTTVPNTTSGGWGGAGVTTFLRNPTAPGPLFGGPTFGTQNLWRAARPANMPYQAGGGVGTRTPLVESYVIYRNPEVEDIATTTERIFGSPSSFVLNLGSPTLINGDRTATVYYTIAPMTCEYPDLAVPAWLALNGDAVTAQGYNFRWPTDVTSLPARNDDINKVSYGSVVRDADYVITDIKGKR